MRRATICWVAALSALIVAATPAFADNEDRCIGPVASASPLLRRAAMRLDHVYDFGWIPSKIINVIDSKSLERDQRERPVPAFSHPALVATEANAATLTFIGHSTFVIESPGGVTIATDYNDYVRPRLPPQVATMNRAHDTHFTMHPDPAIKHVLRGWAEPGQPADHDLRVGDVRIRNVPTNIRDGYGATSYYGNSIFVFEISGLCVAHLGHLHHTLTPKHLAALGPIEIVLVPVDGSYTLNVDGMMETLQQINAPLMIPMHYFGASTLQRFLDKARDRAWDVERSSDPSVVVSRATLPQKPKVLVLPGR